MQEQLNELIRSSIKGERTSQSQLYALFVPKMFPVCLRYSRSREEAEEVLLEGFMKVFTNLGQYSFSGPFEGWVRRIMVNCALQKYRNKKPLHAVLNVEDVNALPKDDELITSHIAAKELIQMVQLLPQGYRMVFNLYVFEGMKHKEIPEHLGISEGTSKSNLSDARAILKKAVSDSERIAKQNTR